jgi:hypothetical protein
MKFLFLFFFIFLPIATFAQDICSEVVSGGLKYKLCIIDTNIIEFTLVKPDEIALYVFNDSIAYASVGSNGHLTLIAFSNLSMQFAPSCDGISDLKLVKLGLSTKCRLSFDKPFKSLRLYFSFVRFPYSVADNIDDCGFYIKYYNSNSISIQRCR